VVSWIIVLVFPQVVTAIFDAIPIAILKRRSGEPPTLLWIGIRKTAQRRSRLPLQLLHEAFRQKALNRELC
jgi:hypothetical protein